MKQSLTCILIDDEMKCRLSLRAMLEKYCPEVTILAEAEDKISIINALKNHKPDLIFIDIEIGSLSAFDILNEFDTIDFKIVFVTAHDEYALQGYKYDAIDYVLKPVSSHALKTVVEKMLLLKKIPEKLDTQEKFQELYAKILGEPKISISDHKKMRLVRPNDILYCMGQGNYTSFMLIKGNEIVTSKSLKFNEAKLLMYNFIRIHKSYLVNLSHIDYIDKEYGGSVVMSNGKSLPISKNYRKTLYKKIDQI